MEENTSAHPFPRRRESIPELILGKLGLLRDSTEKSIEEDGEDVNSVSHSRQPEHQKLLVPCPSNSCSVMSFDFSEQFGFDVHCRQMSLLYGDERGSYADLLLQEFGAGNEARQVPTERVLVQVKVVFLKIRAIDTLREQFSADIYIQARWTDPFLTCQEAESTEHEKLWNPNLVIDNLNDEAKEPKVDTWMSVQSTGVARPVVSYFKKIKGVFFERLELEHFPFDTQELSITISSSKGVDEVELIEDQNELSEIHVAKSLIETEWELYKHVETELSEGPAYKGGRNRHPRIMFQSRASRKPGFFIWNLLVIMLSICCLGFATFAVDIDKPQNRLQLSFTLVLTAVAFKFVANQSLPKISYLTYLDYYILLSMAFLCVLCAWHGIVSQVQAFEMAEVAKEVVAHPSINSTAAELMRAKVREEGLAHASDRYAKIFLAVFLVAYHAVLLFIINRSAISRRRLMTKKDQKYTQVKAAKKLQRKMRENDLHQDETADVKSELLPAADKDKTDTPAPVSPAGKPTTLEQISVTVT